MEQKPPGMTPPSTDEQIDQSPETPLLNIEENNENLIKETIVENSDLPTFAINPITTDDAHADQSTSRTQVETDSVKLTPADAMKNSLVSIMAPVVYELDDRILAVKESQLQLQSLIKRLLEELNSYVDLAHPPKLQDSINKLVGARRRLSIINTTLFNVQERLDAIYGFMQGNQDP